VGDIQELIARLAEGPVSVKEGFVTIPRDDYARMLEIVLSHDDIDKCETCGAWLDVNDPARASTGDYIGCWKVASDRKDCDHLCRSYRALD
jgi:hypothetical protein